MMKREDRRVSKRSNQPVVLITGGSQGLGYGLAATLLRKGARVVICARRNDVLQQANEELSRLGEVCAIRGDIADDGFRSLLVDTVRDRFGRLDGLINNASSIGQLPLPEVLHFDSVTFLSTFSVNTLAPFDLIRRAMPLLVHEGPALILGISSDAATGAYPGWGMYGSTKAAADLLYRTLGEELPESSSRFTREEGEALREEIAVYTVDPGDMATEMHASTGLDTTHLAKPQDVAEVLFPLFNPLFAYSDSANPSMAKGEGHEGTWPFPSGSRLGVVGNRLEVRS